MQSFLEALNDRVLVCDGAMGTMLYAKGIFINKSFDALNLSSPELVGDVHQEYVRAGARRRGPRSNWERAATTSGGISCATR